MAEHERLPDRWHTRDFPVLLAAAPKLDEGQRPIEADAIAQGLDISEDDVVRALNALVPAYLTGKPRDAWGGPIGFTVSGITERGRRAVGLWPSGEAADALVDALRKAEAATEDPDEKSLLSRAAGAVGSVSRGVMTDVIAAVVRQQTGLGG